MTETTDWAEIITAHIRGEDDRKAAKNAPENDPWHHQRIVFDQKHGHLYRNLSRPK